MLLRPAREGDLPAVKKILLPWIEDDPGLLQALENLFKTPSDKDLRCRLLETDETLRCVSFWARTGPDRVRLLAFGVGNGASEAGADRRLLQEEILEWTEMGIIKVKIRLPECLGPSHIGCLRGCGFIAEGVVSRMGAEPRIRLCKHFLNRTMPHRKVMDFLREFFVSMGYEVRDEGGGFGYRVRNELRRPYIFSSWHRITRSGPDLIVHPPARVLAWHELETAFYPLSVQGPKKQPLFLPMEKKMAMRLVDLPPSKPDTTQRGLFSSDPYEQTREIRPNTLIYGYPVGMKQIRRGLPLIFYVNRMGAVGAARVEEWYLDEPKNLYNLIDEMSLFEPEDVKEQAAGSGAHSGKVLAIRFGWYRPFRRVVTLEEVRRLDENFNPRRTRSLSHVLFNSIITSGNKLD